MNISEVFNNFARGHIDHDMMGRTELPIYRNGYDIFKNFITNFKGNAIFRTGFEYILTHQDCAFLEFKFSQNQNYILVLYANKMRFLSYDGSGNFGWVLSGGSPLEVTTPWTLAESKEIAFSKSYSQNFDVMIITHPDHEPQKLIRNGAASFTLRPYARKFDPFPLTWDTSKTITAVTQATTAQITTSAAHGYSVGDRVKIESITGMTELNNWTAAILTVPTSTTFTIDIDTTSFTAYSSGGTTKEVLTGDYPSRVLFYKGRLCYSRVTTVFMSEVAEYFAHELPTTVTDESALQITIAEIAQDIEWLYAGDNSLIVGAGDGIVAINGGGVGTAITAATVEASLTSADPTSSADPIRKDGFIFYISQNRRNLYYFNYDILSETFTAKDANIISYDLTKELLKKVRRKKDRNDLVFALRDDGQLLSLNFNVDEKIVGWHEWKTSGQIKDIAVIKDNDGNDQLFVLAYRNAAYYIEQLSPYVEFASRNDFIGTSESSDDEAAYRYMADQMLDCIYLDNATVFSNYKTTSITYDSGAGTITAASSVFSAGDVGKHIIYKTATGYESGRFLITAYTSGTVVEVDVLQTPTANTYASWYLSMTSLTGLSRFNTYEVGIVTDGGYLKTETVSGGAITLADQAGVAVVGFLYTGTIKSFPLGYQIQGANTQTTFKAFSRIGLRAVGSAGGKFGSTPYRLEPFQDIQQGSLNYLPPLPIDGTKYISYPDDNSIDHCFYIVQDEPLPLQITSVLPTTSHVAL